MTFRYFAHPGRFVGFLEEETSCDLCRQTRQCFDAGAFFGEESIAAICPDCLAGGKLREREIFTCEGDQEELQRQLQALHPDLPADDLEKLARQKTDDLEKTTPKLISWQDWPWPCADGDYCIFIGYGSRPLYNQLAEDRDGEELFKNSIYYTQEEDSDVEALWEESVPRKEIRDYEASSEQNTLFYVFKSLNGPKIVTIWDEG